MFLIYLLFGILMYAGHTSTHYFISKGKIIPTGINAGGYKWIEYSCVLLIATSPNTLGQKLISGTWFAVGCGIGAMIGLWGAKKWVKKYYPKNSKNKKRRANDMAPWCTACHEVIESWNVSYNSIGVVSISGNYQSYYFDHIGGLSQTNVDIYNFNDVAA